MNTVASLHSVSKVYGTPSSTVLALDHVTLQVAEHQFTAIMGPSGCGKSTLLHMLAALDTPTNGEVVIAGDRVSALDDDEITELRRRHIGFIFQTFNLIPTLTARANITLPVTLAGQRVDEEWLDTIVTRLNLTGRLGHRPSEMSGGQVQRTAIARALLMRPTIIVADEPTGNLDTQAADEVLDLLRAAVDEYGQSVVMVTHDAGAAAIADRVVIMRDGRIIGDLDHPTRAQVDAASNRKAE